MITDYKKGIAGVLLIFLSMLFPRIILSCSAFLIQGKGRIVCGKSEAFDSGEGFISINKRNCGKSAIRLGAYIPARWTSKYGSVTFNTIAIGMPFGGMNEKGLVVETLWHDAAQYPEAKNVLCLNELQIVQYLLDLCDSVPAVEMAISKIGIASVKAPVHYFLADAEGNSAVLEFIDGKMVFSPCQDANTRVITNDSYQRSLEYLNLFQNFGGKRTLPISMDRLDRFVRLATFSKAWNESPTDYAIAYAFDMLSNVIQKKWQWNAVYDISQRKIYYTHRKNWKIKEIAIEQLNLECRSGLQVLDMNCDRENGVESYFRPYAPEDNRLLVERVFTAVAFLNPLPPTVRETLAAYPQSIRFCEGTPQKD